MATTFTTPHILQPARYAQGKATQSNQRSNQVENFVGDLVEDLQERPLQPAHLAKHDMFREHINAMSICYFALIVLLIATSLPVLAYMIPWQGL
jgi:hypothetical protein